MAAEPTPHKDATKTPDPAPQPIPAPVQPVRTLPTPPKIADERYVELREIRQLEYFFRAPRTFAVEDLLRRECWSSIAGRLRVATKIIAMREDGEWYVELVVFGVGVNWAEVRVISGPISGAGAIGRATAADDFAIEYSGLIQEWTVRRKSDGAFIKNDGTLKTEVAAQAWLREYLATVAKNRVA